MLTTVIKLCFVCFETSKLWA